MLVARREDKLAEVKAEIEKAGSKAQVIPLTLDVTDRKQVAGLLAKLPSSLQVDILVNNAGGVHGMEPVGDSELALLLSWDYAEQ